MGRWSATVLIEADDAALAARMHATLASHDDASGSGHGVRVLLSPLIRTSTGSCSAGPAGRTTSPPRLSTATPARTPSQPPPDRARPYRGAVADDLRADLHHTLFLAIGGTPAEWSDPDRGLEAAALYDATLAQVDAVAEWLAGRTRSRSRH